MSKNDESIKSDLWWDDDLLNQSHLLLKRLPVEQVQKLSNMWLQKVQQPDETFATMTALLAYQTVTPSGHYIFPASSGDIVDGTLSLIEKAIIDSPIALSEDDGDVISCVYFVPFLAFLSLRAMVQDPRTVFKAIKMRAIDVYTRMLPSLSEHKWYEARDAVRSKALFKIQSDVWLGSPLAKAIVISMLKAVGSLVSNDGGSTKDKQLMAVVEFCLLKPAKFKGLPLLTLFNRASESDMLKENLTLLWAPSTAKSFHYLVQYCERHKKGNAKYAPFARLIDCRYLKFFDVRHNASLAVALINALGLINGGLKRFTESPLAVRVLSECDEMAAPYAAAAGMVVHHWLSIQTERVIEAFIRRMGDDQPILDGEKHFVALPFSDLEKPGLEARQELVRRELQENYKDFGAAMLFAARQYVLNPLEKCDLKESMPENVMAITCTTYDNYKTIFNACMYL